MSRSKRLPYFRDSKPTCNYYNKQFRRVNKQRVNSCREPLLMRELVNDWDICDWVDYRPELKEAYRK